MISIENLKIFLPSFTLGPVSLTIEQGSFFALMGPTGSGKTLLIESLSGLLRPDEGKIRIDNIDITRLPPEQRNIGLVYQDHCLFPHLTVMENVMYGQRYNNLGKQEGKNLANELMDMLSIIDLKDRKPGKLSGGEKQRVSLARALACKPAIVLLDEPLSSLDPQFREGLRKNIKQLHEASDATFFMVTHDFVDSLALTDKAAVIRNGTIQQCGETLDIFHRPATTFIADFVGMKNIIEANYDQENCTFCETTIHKPEYVTWDRGYIALRPEDITLVLPENNSVHRPSLPGIISAIHRDGFVWIATVQCLETVFTVRLEHRMVLDRTFDVEKNVVLTFNPDAVHHIAA